MDSDDDNMDSESGDIPVGYDPSNSVEHPYEVLAVENISNTYTPETFENAEVMFRKSETESESMIRTWEEKLKNMSLVESIIGTDSNSTYYLYALLAIPVLIIILLIYFLSK